jgi:two-component system cell cycle sensor histidine kinase/response regulator CckA
MKLAHEILLALAYVSQISDPDSVRARFVESLNELNEAYGFEYFDPLPQGVPGSRVFPIATLRSSFGYAVMAECPDADDAERSACRNAFRLLAVLLENRQHEQALRHEHKTLQKEISQEKSMVRTVLDTLPVGVLVSDADGVILMSNVAGQEIWGGVRHVGPDHYADYRAWHADTDSLLAADDWPISRVLATGGTVTGEEIHIQSFDGLHKTILVSAAPITDDEGRMLGAVSVNQDISEREQAEKALRESEDRYRNLVELSPGAVMVDVGGKYAYANPAASRLFGADSSRDVIGMEVIELVHPDYRALVAERAAQVLTGEATGPLEIKILRLDESPVEVEAIAGKIEFEGRQAAQVIYRDITERKRAEETLLERDEQLRQSQKMEAVGQLAGGIAHDFNNLLTAIIGYSDILLASGASSLAAARPDIEEIRLAAERAASLTKQILAFSRRQTLRPMAVSLNDILTGMEPLLRRTLGEDVDLFILTDPGLDHVEVDIHQFEQVIMNLAINARDAMASGGRLTLETVNVELDEGYCLNHPGSTPGRQVLLSVSDTGAGMDDVTRARVFEPFFTTKAPGAGTGLGLATVYGTVKQSHGSIFVRSEPGQGTTFKVYLPRVTAPEQARNRETNGKVLLRGNEIILAVEDEAPLRNLVARILEGLGYRVLLAGTGEEALQVAKEVESHFDLLLTDLVLPGGMRGNDLARDLRARTPGLPVLYMSGYARDTIARGGRLDVEVNFLEKPFTPEALATMVRHALDTSG